MAKLFYTLEEAAQKLNKTTDQVMQMAQAGQLQELRDKDQVLFRRSAIDQIAGDGDTADLNLEGLDLSSGGSSIQLGGSSIALGGDDLRLEDDLRVGSGAPVAASGASDSIGLDDLTLADDDAPAPSAPAARAAPAAKSPAASSGGSRIGLADSNADSMMMAAAPGTAGRGADDSMAIAPGQTQLEAVGSGSGLLDISSDESFFGAQMIEESMGGDDAAAIPDNATDIFGGGEAAATEEVAPVTAGTTGVTFGTAQLAEARDPRFSGFTAGAMVVAAAAMVAMGWSVAEMSLGNYTDVGRMIAENWMYVLGGAAGGILVFGGIGFGIGKATA